MGWAAVKTERDFPVVPVKGKTIAFNLALVFLLDRIYLLAEQGNQILMNSKQIVSNMIIPHSFHLYMQTAILCLCLGSLAMLPLTQAGPFMLEMYEFESENTGFFEYSEFDDEFFFTGISLATYAELASLKSRSMHLNFRSANLSPESPPPKQ